MKQIQYQTQGTCSKLITVQVDDSNCIQSVSFLGGCNGNLQGISRLVQGMDASEAKQRLRGICCGTKGTSCPDQLARALEELDKQRQSL